MFWVVPGMNYAQLEIYIFILFICLTCVNFIGKRHGLAHPLRAMLVHSLLCKSMKRCLVMVKVGITRIVVSYAHL